MRGTLKGGVSNFHILQFIEYILLFLFKQGSMSFCLPNQIRFKENIYLELGSQV